MCSQFSSLGVFVRCVGSDGQGVVPDRRSGHPRVPSISGSALVTGHFHGPATCLGKTAWRRVCDGLQSTGGVSRWGRWSARRRAPCPAGAGDADLDRLDDVPVTSLDPLANPVGEQADLRRPCRVGRPRRPAVGRRGAPAGRGRPRRRRRSRSSARTHHRSPAPRRPRAVTALHRPHDAVERLRQRQRVVVILLVSRRRSMAHGSMIAPSAMRMTRSGCRRWRDRRRRS